MTPFFRIFTVFLLASLAGCSATGKTLQSASPGRDSPGLAVGDVIDTATGQVLTLDELVRRLSDSSIVYIGEVHTSSEDHKAQLAILGKLYEQAPCVSLAMEMFPRTAQPVLDRYARGEATEEQFLKEVRWDRVWGFPFPLYRGLIDFARERRLRIFGLNAPRGVVRKIARNGLASLSPEDRARVARDFHLDAPRDRLRVKREFEAHGKKGIKDFESFFEAQLAWEETMAETLAERLEETGGRCRIVAIIGRGHMRDRLGIPHLVRLRAPHAYKTVAPVPVDYPGGTVDPALGDYVLITDKSRPFHPPRLGVMVGANATGGGTEVANVMPDSPAARAGIRKRDVIVSVDGVSVNSPEELREAFSKEGPSHRISIKRAGKSIDLDVEIGPQ